MITTDKRYQVFVSSTYDDLQDERKEVMQALLELDCIPAGMDSSRHPAKTNGLLLSASLMIVITIF